LQFIANAAYMIDFPEALQIQFATYIDAIVLWLTKNYSHIFDAIRDGILFVLNGIESFLVWIPWALVILIVFLLGWRLKSLLSGIIYTILVTFIGALGLWDLMMYTLAIVLVSVVIALVIGIPCGILISANNILEKISRPILDAMQTLPSFVYLIPAVMFFSMGKVPAVFATTVYALPPIVRLTNLGIRGVNAEMVEAARSFGSTYWQVLLKVQLPQALPSIMAGMNQTTMMAMSMVVTASMIGAKGLGNEVLIALNRLEIGRGFESGVAIVIIAVVIDRLFQASVSKSKKSAQINQEEA
jgi:glycine betaine/proline transport system permease protein